jgi:hypothetical protein
MTSSIQSEKSEICEIYPSSFASLASLALVPQRRLPLVPSSKRKVHRGKSELCEESPPSLASFAFFASLHRPARAHLLAPGMRWAPRVEPVWLALALQPEPAAGGLRPSLLPKPGLQFHRPRAARRWAAENKIRQPLTRAEFRSRLRKKGCQPARTESFRGWKGLRLRAGSDPMDAEADG